MCPNRWKVNILFYEQKVYERGTKTVKILTCLQWFSHVALYFNAVVRQSLLSGLETNQMKKISHVYLSKRIDLKWGWERTLYFHMTNVYADNPIQFVSSIIARVARIKLKTISDFPEGIFNSELFFSLISCPLKLVNQICLTILSATGGKWIHAFLKDISKKWM